MCIRDSYQTLYTACPGHTKYSAAVITLHFNSLLNIKNWWKKNIYCLLYTSSMVDTELMYHLVKAVKSGSKLILSGDPDPVSYTHLM